jgi:hypothetical protein
MVASATAAGPPLLHTKPKTMPDVTASASAAALAISTAELGFWIEGCGRRRMADIDFSLGKLRKRPTCEGRFQKALYSEIMSKTVRNINLNVMKRDECAAA